jgi:hypothetical protein
LQKNQHKHGAMKHVFESLEDTFQFGKFKGFTLKEVYTGNSSIDLKLLHDFLKHLIDTNDRSLIMARRMRVKLSVEKFDEKVIGYGYKDLNPPLTGIEELKNKEPHFIENMVYNLIFDQPHGDTMRFISGNYNIVEFALNNYSHTEKLPGESSSVIAWYIKNVSDFCVNPAVLTNLITHDVYEFTTVQLTRIRNLEFSYTAVFKREQRSFSRDIIDLNASKYAARHAQHESNRTNDDESTYHRYQGSYASDEMGFSDQTIDDVFDGDPDAYWNID